MRPALEAFDCELLKDQLMQLASQKPQQYVSLDRGEQVVMSAIGG